MITGSDKNANSPSAITIAGRCDGMVSGQLWSATDATTEWARLLIGNSRLRNAMTPGRSTLYQSTAGGGLTRNGPESSPAPRSTTTASGFSDVNARTRSSSILARSAAWHTTLVGTPSPAKS